MKNNVLKNFFDEKKEEISFITLKKGATLPLGEKTYIARDELLIPVRIDNLINDIKKQDKYDGITVKNIIDGIIYIIGTNKEFDKFNDYIEILNVFESNIESYIIHSINNFSENEIDSAIIYGKSLINICENEKNCFVYGNALEKKALEYLENGFKKEANSFLKEAELYFEKCLDFDDTFSLAYYKLGFYYKSKQQYIRAGLYWEKFIKFDDDTNRIDEIRNEINELQIFINYEKGYNYVLNGETQKGLELLLPIAEKRSGWWNLLFFIGLAYRLMKEYKIAEKYFENVIKLNPNQLDAINELGLCSMCLDKFEKAIELFNTALNINPNNSEIMCNRAAAYIYINDIEKAEKDINKVLEINNNDEIAISIKKEIEKIREQR